MDKYKLVDVLLSIHSGGTPSTKNSEYWNGNLKWLSSGETSQDFISDTLNHITNLGVKNSSTKLAHKGDVVIACAGQGKTRGQVSLLLCDMYINQSVIALTSNKNIIYPLYLYYNLKNRYNELRGGSDSSSIRGSITTSNLKNLSIYLPSLKVQKKSADVLYSIDTSIINNNKRIKLLEQMAENLYKEWFVRFRFPGYENAEFENGIPKGWSIKLLSEISDIIMGQSPKSEYYNSNEQGLPFHQGVGSYGELYLIDDVYSTQGNRIAEPNSIIFSVRAPVGRININLTKVILGRGLTSINSKSNNNHFLLWQLKYMFKKEDVIGNGSIFTSVTKDELLKQKVIVPKKEILEKYNHLASLCEMQIRKLYLSNQNLIKQRDLLLPRLMSGKLEVK